MNGGEHMDKDSIIMEATKAALDEVKEANEGRLRLAEDIVFRLIEKDRERNARLLWLLPAVAVIQLVLFVLMLFAF